MQKQRTDISAFVPGLGFDPTLIPNSVKYQPCPLSFGRLASGAAKIASAT